MAITDYGLNHPLAVKIWSKKLAREALKMTYISKFMGEDSNNLCQIFDELNKGAGDRIRWPLRMQLSGRGVSEAQNLEGNEEALTTYYDEFVVNEIIHGVRVATGIDAQRIPFSARDEAAMGLADWMADRFDNWAANQLTGYTDQTDVIYSGNNAVTAIASATAGSNPRFIYGGLHNAGSEASLSASTQKFSLGMLDLAVKIAKTSTPLIRPIRSGNQQFYVAFLHPDQVLSLRRNTSTGEWLDLQKTAMTGGEIEENPIFTGALGVYNGVIMHEWLRLPGGAEKPLSSNATVRRGVFCGAQALGWSWAKGYSMEPKVVEEDFDYKRQFGTSVQSIAGCKRTRFNSIDFATIALSTYELGTL